MQMRSILSNIAVLLMLLIASFSNCILSLAKGSDPRVLLPFRTAHSEKRRLRAFIAAVDQRLIFLGMKVVDLDELLGSRFSAKVPIVESSIYEAEYKFGELDNSWRLVVAMNARGIVCGYCLSRYFLKSDSYSAEPTVDIAKIENRFRKAKTPSQRLECAIQAFESRLFKCGSQKSTLVTIFGNSTEDKVVKSVYGYPSRETDIISSYIFGTSKNSWRVITSGSSDKIYDSILTNYDCENSDEFSEARWPLIPLCQ